MAESRAGGEACRVGQFGIFVKGRKTSAAFGRNPGDLAVYG